MTNRRRCHGHVHCRSQRAATQTKLMVLGCTRWRRGLWSTRLLSRYETTLNTEEYILLLSCRDKPKSRLGKSQCTCSSGFSRVLSVTVGPCFKCDRSLVALAAVSNHGYPSKKAHLFHADTQRVRAQRLRPSLHGACTARSDMC